MNSSNQYVNNTSPSFAPVLAGIPDLSDETAQAPIGADRPSITEVVYTAPPETKQTLRQDQAPGDVEIPLSHGEIHQPAMRIEIPAVPTPSTETTDGFFKLRPWQANCFVALGNSRNWIINAPTAAG